MTEDEGLADFQKDFAGKVLTIEYPKTLLKRFCRI